MDKIIIILGIISIKNAKGFEEKEQRPFEGFVLKNGIWQKA